MKQFLEKLRVEDWVTVWLSIPLLLLAIFIPHSVPSVPSTFVGEAAWHDILILFIIVLVALYLGSWLMRRPMKGMLWSLIFVFAISMLAQVVAKIDIVKEFGFEAVFFSVIFGLIIRNVWHIPEWMKPAIQGEFFIKIGVVCLGATVLFNEVMKSGAYGLMQAILVVGIVWFFAFWISRKMGVDERSAMVLSSGMSICGVSACITASRVANCDDKKLSYIVSLVLIIVVPMIYLMPWLANTILPLIFDDPMTINEVAGAWIGGTVDTTSGVGASSAIVSDDANKVAMVVKGVQNILIGVVAFFIALYLSARSESGKMQRPSLGIVWEKFPKFVLGFVIASALFSVLSANDMLKKGELKEPKAQEVVADVKVSPEKEASKNVIAAAELNAEQPVIVADAAVNNEELKAAPKAEKKPERKKNSSKDIAKMFSGLFFSLAFVCIGLDTRLKDIISKENRALLKSFLIAQTFNIIVTFVLACVFFGVLKQM
jgi:uncharacterized integral membrane protein (TIGR00698 family)